MARRARVAVTGESLYCGNGLSKVVTWGLCALVCLSLDRGTREFIPLVGYRLVSLFWEIIVKSIS